MCYLIRGKFIKKRLKMSHKTKLSLLSIYWNYQKKNKFYFLSVRKSFMSTQKHILLTEISSNKVFWQATREICWVTPKLGAPQVGTIFFDSVLTCSLHSAAPGGNIQLHLLSLPGTLLLKCWGSAMEHKSLPNTVVHQLHSQQDILCRYKCM